MPSRSTAIRLSRSRALVRYRPSGSLVKYAPSFARAAPLAVAAGYGIARGINKGKKIVKWIKKNNGGGKKPPSSSSKGSQAKRSRPRNVSGVYQGKIKPRQSSDNKLKFYNKRGIVHTIENGGILSAVGTGAVYPVHGLASKEVLRSAFCAIVKEIARQRKTDVRNWTDLVTFNDNANNFCTQMLYINNPGVTPRAAPTTLTYVLPSGGSNVSWRQFAINLLEYFQDNSGAGAQPKEMIQIQCFGLADNGATQIGIPLATIHCNNVKFQFHVKSEITIQNRTLGDTADGDQDDSDDVEAQPLVGKLYTGTKQWQNYVELQNQGLSAGNQGAKSTVCHKETGIALFQSGGALTEYPDTMTKIPPAWMLGFKKGGKFTLNPGEVKKTSFVFNATISLTKLFQIYSHDLGNSSANTTSFKSAFGFVQMLGLEKSVDVQRNSGSNVRVGYQLDGVYACALKYKKAVPSNPSMSVNINPVNYSTDKP
jgi:hypothetical protein